MLHLNGLMFWWTNLMCFFMLPLPLKTFLQMGHGRLFICLLSLRMFSSWTFTVDCSFNFSLQIELWKFFFFSRTFSECIFSSGRLLNFFCQIIHWRSFFVLICQQLLGWKITWTKIKTLPFLFVVVNVVVVAVFVTVVVGGGALLNLETFSSVFQVGCYFVLQPRCHRKGIFLVKISMLRLASLPSRNNPKELTVPTREDPESQLHKLKNFQCKCQAI